MVKDGYNATVFAVKLDQGDVSDTRGSDSVSVSLRNISLVQWDSLYSQQ